MKKRVLLTGGAGFIGSQLCSRLLNDSNEVICLDNFFAENKKNIINLLSNPYFELIRHDITIYGNGMQSRSFQYIDDLITGLIKLMGTNNDFHGPVNIGNPNEFTIIDLAKKIIFLTGSKSNLVYKPLPEDDPMQRQPIIELGKKELNWEPKIELEQGLIKAIKYFKEIL